jgi:hypothetical protein
MLNRIEIHKNIISVRKDPHNIIKSVYYFSNVVYLFTLNSLFPSRFLTNLLLKFFESLYIIIYITAAFQSSTSP